MSASRAENLGRQHWLAQRKRGLAGTDAAAILGVHPWKTAFDVWAEKTNRIPDQEQSKAMKWGLLLEDAIAGEYMERTGRKVWAPDRLFTHPEHPFLVGTPDRLVIDEKRGVDLKTSGAYQEKHWGSEETDDIPRHYLVQACHYMALLDYPEWDVFVLIGGNDDRLYTVKRDLAFEKLLIGRLNDWWERYVVNDEQPQIDDGAGAAAFIQQLYPEHRAPRIGATEEAQEIGEALTTVSLQIKTLEKEKEAYRNRLKLAIGPAKGMDGQGWRATWCGGNEKSVVDHEQLSRELIPVLQKLGKFEVVNEAIAKATTTKKTTESFRFTHEGNAEE